MSSIIDLSNALNAEVDKRTEEYPKLTLASVCDRCGYVHQTNSAGQDYAGAVSRAYVRVWFASGNHLDFCGHHYSINEAALLPVAIHVEDTRGQLTANGTQPGASA